MSIEEKIDRINKLPNPLLVIGLGGTGADCVRKIKNKFIRRYNIPLDAAGNMMDAPENTAYYVIDTTANTKAGFTSTEFRNITVPGLKQILTGNGLLNSYEESWIHKNLDSVAEGHGAGTYRQASRLMLFRNYRVIRDDLEQKLDYISTVKAGQLEGGIAPRVEVVIIAGISGGTGSGTMLDIAQIIASFKNTHNQRYKNMHITGYAVMPDVSISNVRGNEDIQEVLKANAFAALKEIDFWMRSNEHKTNYSVEYTTGESIKWGQPFNQCVLCCGSAMESGEQVSNAYDNIADVISETLLHYLAAENVAGGNGEWDIPTYSYIQAEDNIKAASEAMSMSKPLLYKYRAIGGVHRRMPNQKIKNYEAKIILESFIPPINSQTKASAINIPYLKNETIAIQALEIAGKLKEVTNKYVCRLPEFASYSPNDKGKMSNLKLMKPLPHNRENGDQHWMGAVAKQSAFEYAENTYFDSAWKRFEDFAISVITDFEQGPYSLEKYLSDPEGLCVKLLVIAREWHSKAEKLETDVSNLYKACCSLWGAFCKPDIINILTKKAENQYMTALSAYYSKIRDMYLMRFLADNLDRLVDRIKNYRERSLLTICESIKSIYADADSIMEENLIEDIVSMDPIENIINNRFRDENIDNKIRKSFINNVADESLKFQPDLTKSAGIRWNIESEEKITEQIVKVTDEAFSGLTYNSIDGLMQQTYKDSNEINEEIKIMTDKIIANADPMFSDFSARGTEGVKYQYFSVPASASRTIDTMAKHLSANENTIKKSNINDYIYCLKSVDALPIFRYAMIENIESAYERKIASSNYRGVHLVEKGDSSLGIDENWLNMPSPSPFYIFGTDASTVRIFAKRNFNEVKELVENALKNGQLNSKLDVENEREKYSVDWNMLYYEGNKILTSSNNIINEIDDILSDVDVDDLDKKQKLEAILLRCKKIRLDVNNRYEAFMFYLNLTGKPVKPTLAENKGVQEHEKAVENYTKLSNMSLIHMFISNPFFVRDLKLQSEGFEKLYDSISKLKDELRKRKNYIAKCNLVSRLLIFDALKFNNVNISFTDEIGTEHILLSTINDINANIDDSSIKQPRIVQLVKVISEFGNDNPLYKGIVELHDKNMKEFAERDDLSYIESLKNRGKKLVIDMEKELNEVDYNKRNLSVNDKNITSMILKELIIRTQNFMPDHL